MYSMFINKSECTGPEAMYVFSSKKKLLNSFKSSCTKLHNLQKFMLLSFVSHFCQNMVFAGHFLPIPSNTSLIAFHSAIDSIFVLLNFKTSDFYNFSP